MKALFLSIALGLGLALWGADGALGGPFAHGLDTSGQIVTQTNITTTFGSSVIDTTVHGRLTATEPSNQISPKEHHSVDISRSPIDETLVGPLQFDTPDGAVISASSPSCEVG